MFNKIAVFQAATMMARHATERQQHIAENIANADTPDYKARDIAPFADIYASAAKSPNDNLKHTQFRTHLINHAGVASPNGNTVSLEDQMWRSAAAARQHETAVTIYGKSLNLLRTALGGR
ncbi:MAG: FlgB family protein [Pseudomonadota bacterium]